MPVYVYDAATDRMVDKRTGEPMVDGPWRPAVPVVYGDMGGYHSPVDGRWIDGRRARRYDLEKNNCVDANDIGKPKRLKNRKFARKHGLEHLLDN